MSCPYRGSESYKEVLSIIKNINTTDVILQRNNGFPLDRNYLGKPSSLYNSIFDIVQNRKEAILIKSRIYADTFKNDFGPWKNEEIAIPIINTYIDSYISLANPSEIVINNNMLNINGYINTTPSKKSINNTTYNVIGEIKDSIGGKLLILNNEELEFPFLYTGSLKNAIATYKKYKSFTIKYEFPIVLSKQEIKLESTILTHDKFKGIEVNKLYSLEEVTKLFNIKLTPAHSKLIGDTKLQFTNLPKNIEGAYKGGIIQISISSINPTHTIVHELIHSLTVYKYYSDIDYKSKIDQAFKDIHSKLKGKIINKYEISNALEMIVYSYQDDLSTIKNELSKYLSDEELDNILNLIHSATNVILNAPDKQALDNYIKSAILTTRLKDLYSNNSIHYTKGLDYALVNLSIDEQQAMDDFSDLQYVYNCGLTNNTFLTLINRYNYNTQGNLDVIEITNNEKQLDNIVRSYNTKMDSEGNIIFTFKNTTFKVIRNENDPIDKYLGENIQFKVQKFGNNDYRFTSNSSSSKQIQLLLDVQNNTLNYDGLDLTPTEAQIVVKQSILYNTKLSSSLLTPTNLEFIKNEVFSKMDVSLFKQLLSNTTSPYFLINILKSVNPNIDINKILQFVSKTNQLSLKGLPLLSDVYLYMFKEEFKNDIDINELFIRLNIQGNSTIYYMENLPLYNKDNNVYPYLKDILYYYANSNTPIFNRLNELYYDSSYEQSSFTSNTSIKPTKILSPDVELNMNTLLEGMQTNIEETVSYLTQSNQLFLELYPYLKGVGKTDIYIYNSFKRLLASDVNVYTALFGIDIHSNLPMITHNNTSYTIFGKANPKISDLEAANMAVEMENNEPKLINDAFFMIPNEVENEVPILDTHEPLRETRIPLLESKIYPNYETELTKKLQNSFNKLGVFVKIVVDNTIQGHSVVETIDGVITIKVNSTNVSNESIFHEFGHIYIDMITDKELLQSMINSLRYTELWKSIKTLYPELTDEQLGREVLTTAIGANAETIFQSREEKIRWYNWLRDIYVNLMSLLGSPRYKIELLSKELVTGDMTLAIDNTIRIEQQYHKDKLNLNAVAKFEKLLSVKKNDLVSIMNQFKNDISILDVSVDINKQQKDIQEYFNYSENKSALELAEALNSNIQFELKMLTSLEKEINDLHTMITIKKKDFNVIDEEDFLKIGTTITKANAFLKSILRLDDIAFNELRDLFYDIDEQGNRTLKPMASDIYLFKFIDTLQSIAYGSEFVEETDKDGNIIKVPNITNRDGILERVKQLEVVINSLKFNFDGFVMSNTSNPTLQEATYDDFNNRILNELADETFFQSQFNSTISSNNEYVSNMTKLIKFNKTYADLEIQDRIKVFKDNISKFTSSDLIQIHKNGRLLQYWDETAYWEAYTKNKIKFIEAKVEINKFNLLSLSTNFTIEADILLRIDEKRSEIDSNPNIKDKSQAFKRWYSENIIKVDGKLRGVLFGEFATPKPNMGFEDVDYAKLQSNKELADFHKYLVEEMKYLTEHLSSSPQYKGYLAAISTKKIKHEEDPYALNEELTDIHGNKLFTLPFHFMGYLNDKARILYPKKTYGQTYEQYEALVVETVNKKYKTSFTSLADIEKENEKINKQNKDNHVANLNTDLNYTIPLFIESALLNKYSTKIKDAIHLSLSEMEEFDIVKSNKKGIINQRNKFDENGRPIASKIKGINSKAFKHYNKMIEMVFYDKFTKESDLNKLGFGIKQWTSLVGIGFNPFSAVKNVSYGGYMTIIESNSGHFFNNTDLHEASKMYHSNIVNFYADFYTDKKLSKVSAIIDKFNVIESYNDLLEKTSPETTKQKRNSWFNNAAYGMTSMGEHMMQNTVLLSMLQSHRLVDGKLMSFFDYKRHITQSIEGMTKAEAYKIIKENGEAIKAAELEFNKHIKAIDLFEFKDGVAVFTKDETGKQLLSNKEYANFRLRVMGVNHKMHGIYNKEDKGTIENSILGQLLLQFRHWAIPGWNKRFGHTGVPSLTNKNMYWNEETQEYDAGMYNSFLSYMSKGYREAYKDLIKDESNLQDKLTAVMFSMIKGTQNMISNYKLYWFQMSPEERAGAKRTIWEMIILMSLILLAKALPDDDEEDNSMALNFLIYQIDASKSEMFTFTPFGLINESYKIAANPTGTWSTMTSALNTIIAATSYPFQDEKERRVRSGVNKGNLKVVNYGSRLIPGIGIYKRFQKLEDTNKAYKLFNMPG